jgi:hypothetical protein
MKLASRRITFAKEISPLSGTLPLPKKLRGSLDEKSQVNYAPRNISGLKSGYNSAAAEGRKNSWNKREYIAAIFNHWRDCSGNDLDCKAGDDCKLYAIRRQRRHLSVTLVRRSIKAECVECVGTTEDICTSPECSTYRVRFGRKKRPVTEPAGN